MESSLNYALLGYMRYIVQFGCQKLCTTNYKSNL